MSSKTIRRCLLVLAVLILASLLIAPSVHPGLSAQDLSWALWGR